MERTAQLHRAQPAHAARARVPRDPSMNQLSTAELAEQITGDALWYKDAVVYQLHVKAFFDSNNDGMGDFAGLMSKLDYIQELGVLAIWLLPFYPSPLKDDGYDVSDYHNVHPQYGTMADFRRFVQEATRRGRKGARRAAV